MRFEWMGSRTVLANVVPVRVHVPLVSPTGDESVLVLAVEDLTGNNLLPRFEGRARPSPEGWA